MKDCILVEKDGVRGKIRWKKHKNTEKLMDKDVSVKNMMNGKCAVYSMIFGE